MDFFSSKLFEYLPNHCFKRNTLNGTHLVSFCSFLQAVLSLFGQLAQLLPMFLQAIDVSGDFTRLRVASGHQLSSGFHQLFGFVPTGFQLVLQRLLNEKEKKKNI